MKATYQRGFAYAGVACTHVATAVRNHVEKIREDQRENPEAGEGIVGWLIVIVAVAAIGLWAVGQFTGEVQGRTDCFTLSEGTTAGEGCPTGPAAVDG